jgi:ABC-type sugar transport system substrate-binding protein
MSDRVSRKSVLINLLSLPLAAAAVASVAAPADAKTAPSAVQYVPKSTNGKFCKNCRFYLSAKAAGKPGACTIVSGPIEPLGYCVAYAAK